MRQAVLEAIVVALFGASPALAQPEQPALTNNDVIKMVQAGLSQDVIVKVIAGSSTGFKFTPGDLTALGQANVPEAVFKAMAARQAGQPIPGYSIQPGAAVTTATIPQTNSVEPKSAGNVLSQDPEKYRRALSLVRSINQELTLARETVITGNHATFKYQGITVSEEGELLVLESERFADESFRSAFEKKITTLILSDDKARNAYCYLGFRYIRLSAGSSGWNYPLGCQGTETAARPLSTETAEVAIASCDGPGKAVKNVAEKHKDEQPAFAQWVPPCAKSLKGRNAEQVSACLGPQPDRTLSHGHSLDLWYDLPVGSVRVTFQGDPAKGLLNAHVASVRVINDPVIDDPKRIAEKPKGDHHILKGIATGVAAVGAVILTQAACNEVMQKSFLFWTVTDYQTYQYCKANGFVH